MVADGQQPVTRENRLLSWASEIEVQMASQRQELRRARMELAAAQDVRLGEAAAGHLLGCRCAAPACLS